MDRIIDFQDLSVGYAEKNILERVSASIQRGKITSIIGPNGAGKSTLLKAFGKLLRCRSGHIRIMDQDLTAMSQRELARRVAILLQQNQCPADLSVEKLIHIGRQPHKKWYEWANPQDSAIVQDALEQVNLSHMKDKLICQLSGGERQRVWLAMALAQSTDILLLDEPTTYLDISFQLEILELIRKINAQSGMSIIMVLHDLNQAVKYSDELIILKAGKIVATGRPEELITVDLLRDIYHIDADILQLDGCPHIIPKHWRHT